MKPTPQQHEAIYTHDCNLIVVAGAGSGKTHVLVERYLALLDANPDWPLNALVAVTFTRKAAQEMRDRVRRELEKRHHAAPGQTCWAERLASMESARIDTIHGLCATILRANAAEAGIDPGFEVLEEIDARLMLEDAIDTLLQTLVETDDPAVALLLEYGADAVRAALIDLIAAEIEDLADDLEESWRQAWQDNARRVLQLLLDDATFQTLIQWSPPSGRWPDENSDDKLYSVWQNCWDPLDALAHGENLADRVDALSTLRREIRLQGGKTANWGDKETLNEAKEVLKAIRERAQAALDEIGAPPGELDRRAAELLPLWVSLIRRAQQAYRRAKQDESLLDFDDLERLTRRLLCDFPQVCARYRGAEFKHLLVDEFQDTNAAQWDIVRHLADPAQPGSLFVVGDPKQSIYAFRGADVSVFDDVRRVILDAGGRAIPLAQSFRAHRPLVDGFNHIFANLLVKDPASPVAAYQVAFEEPMTAFRSLPPAGDFPTLEFLVMDKNRLDDEEDRAENCRRWEAAEIAAYLRRVTGMDGSKPRLVYDKSAGAHRPMHYGDAAILFQSTSYVTLYEEALKTAGVPYVTVAGRGYYSRQEVWDLLNLLAALHNPADDLALAAALRSPMFSLSDDALLALRLRRDANGRRRPLWDALDNPDGLAEEEQPRVAFARDCLRGLRGLAGRVTIAELLREILARTGYLAILTALPDGARRRGNVEKLVQKAHAGGQVMLGAFSQYLRDLSDREAREGEAAVETIGAVTLMTVHSSKGLEFPLIVLADASWERGSGSSANVLFDPRHGLTCKVYDATADKLESPFAHRQAENLQKQRETAERRRLLYVAATRAQDYLLVSGQGSPSADGLWQLKGWLGWLWEGLGLQEFAPRNAVLDHYPWGSVSIYVPEHPSDEAPDEEPGVSAWDSPAVQAGQPLPGGTQPSPLLQPVRVLWDAPARHLTATQIADLGSAQTETFYAERFRRSILHDAPSHIGTVGGYHGGVSRRIIGEIVHKALRWWPLPSDKADLEAILESYAWRLGIIIPEQQRQAARQARSLLERFERSDVYTWLKSAQIVYREIPFLYRTGQRFVHGILDVLFQSADGTWVVLDYKTGYVSGCRDDEPGGQRIVEHARRYHLQVGVYAAAVQAQLGDFRPEVYIHYLRYGQTVRIESAQWEAALARLEDYINESLFNRE